MAINIQTPVNNYVGNGSTKIFPYTYKISKSTDIKVYVQNQLIETGYTVSGVNNDAGGNITFTTAPANNAAIVIKRTTSLDREIDYLAGGALSADTLDNDVDRVVMMIQDLRRDVGDGTLTLPDALYSNVKNAGALGNGIDDDTAIIQDVINNAAGKGVFIPEGVFLVSSLSIPSNTTIKGYGSSSVLKMKDAQPDNTWILKNGNFVGGNAKIRLQNFVLDGNDDNQTLGFNNTCSQFHNVSGLVIKNMIVKNGISEGIYAYNCSKPVVIDNEFSGNGPYRGDASGLHLDNCDKAIVVNNQGLDNGFHGMIFTGLTNSVVANNVATGNGYEGMRIQYDSQGNTFIGNVANQNGRNGMYFLSGSDNNILTGNVTNANENDGLAFYQAKNNRINSSQIRNNLNNGVETVDVLDVQIFGASNDISGNTVNQIYNDGGAVQIFENDWDRILNKPTTMAGYGITDGVSTSHNHDGVYQPVGSYSLDTHNHDVTYASISHNHDGSYALATHNHDGSYANYSHTHDALYQPLHSDLTAIGGLSTNGFAKRVGPGNWVIDTNTYLTSISSGDVTTALGFVPYNSTNPSGYITANQNITLSGDVSGSGSTSIAVTINTIPISKGGTGQTTANSGLNALLPTQTGNSDKYLTTDGTNTSWTSISIANALDDLTDVVITTPVADQILKFNGTNWENATPTSNASPSIDVISYSFFGGL